MSAIGKMGNTLTYLNLGLGYDRLSEVGCNSLTIAF